MKCILICMLMTCLLSKALSLPTSKEVEKQDVKEKSGENKKSKELSAENKEKAKSEVVEGAEHQNATDKPKEEESSNGTSGDEKINESKADNGTKAENGTQFQLPANGPHLPPPIGPQNPNDCEEVDLASLARNRDGPPPPPGPPCHKAPERSEKHGDGDIVTDIPTDFLNKLLNAEVGSDVPVGPDVPFVPTDIPDLDGLFEVTGGEGDGAVVTDIPNIDGVLGGGEETVATTDGGKSTLINVESTDNGNSTLINEEKSGNETATAHPKDD